MQLFHLAELKSLYGLQQKAPYRRLHRLKAVLAFDGNHCLLLKEVCSHVKAALKAYGWAVCPTDRGSRDDLDPSSAPFSQGERQVFPPAARHPFWFRSARLPPS